MKFKCKCGNEIGKPRLKPFPISYVDDKTKDKVDLLYMAGIDQITGLCWFCRLDVLAPM